MEDEFHRNLFPKMCYGAACFHGLILAFCQSICLVIVYLSLAFLCPTRFRILKNRPVSEAFDMILHDCCIKADQITFIQSTLSHPF